MGMIPLKGKIPVVKNWTRRRFSQDEIKKHLSSGGNVGWALEEHDLVLDIDPRHGGKEALAELLKRVRLAPDDLRPYPRTLTGGGGMHIWMTLPQSLNGAPTVVKGLRGIEFKRQGSQVVIPPSLHPETHEPYRYVESAPRLYPPPPAPSSILQLLLSQCHEPTGAVPVAKLDVALVLELLRKLDPKDFADNERWFPILAAVHDATGGSKEGCDMFLEWSLADDIFCDHEPIIRARWKSLGKSNKANLITLRTLVAEAARAGNLEPELSAQVEFGAMAEPAPALPPEPPGPPADGSPRDNLKDIGYKIAWYVQQTVYGGKLIHAADQQYWHYIGTHWEPVADNLIESALLDAAAAYLRRAKKCKSPVSTLMSQGRTILRALCATKSDLLGVSGLRPIINCRNGEIHVGAQGSEFKPHDPTSLLTTVLSVSHDPEATCPRFDKALEEIFMLEPDPKEVIRHFWELVGYSLQPDKNIAVWVLFYGNGSNGKSFVLNVLTELWGEAVIEKSVASLDISRNNHALADLPRRLVLVDEDYDYQQLLPDSALKKISENKMLSANPKNRAVFRFRNTAIAILAANGWPQTRDLSDGLRRRALVFNFSRTFSEAEQDLNLLERVKSELPGVLNRALAGYARLRARGNFLTPPACITAKRTWYSQSNQALQFIDEVKDDKAQGASSFGDVWAAYELWAGEQRIKNRFSRNGLKKAFESMGFEINNGKIIGFMLNTENYSVNNFSEF